MKESSSSSNVAVNPLKILFLIALYYPFSIGLTFYQKWFIKDFKFPLTVVCVHYVMKFFASAVIRLFYRCYTGHGRVVLPWSEFVLSTASVGVSASIDIGLSNWALEYITVSLYTMAKSTSIVFMLIFAVILSLERLQWSVISVVGFISCGLFLFTFRSSQFDFTGFLLVELAAVCGGLRWAVSQYLMQRGTVKLTHPLDVIFHVQPWMILTILPLLFAFEGERLSMSVKVFDYNDIHVPMRICGLAIIGGVIAFCMELSEYWLLVCTSGLTLNICGIIKEILTLLLAHFANDDNISFLNFIGLLLCFGGIIVHVWTKTHSTDSQRIDSKDDFVLVSLNENTKPLLLDSSSDEQ